MAKDKGYLGELNDALMNDLKGKSLTAPLSPYLLVLEQEISADLRGVVSAEDLRDEIRKTLTMEVMRRARMAIDEFAGFLSYTSDPNGVQAQKLEATALRHANYAIEIINLRRAQRIDPNYILAAPEVAD